MPKVNPFRPNSPIAPGMFAGRIPQLEALEQALIQTRAGHPKNFLITGERGIGKTSLLRYMKYLAEGYIPIGGEKVKFLVVEVDVDSSSTELGLIRRIQLGLSRELGKTEPARNFLAKGWEFLTRIEAFGVSVREDHEDADPETLNDEFAYSLATTINRVTQTDAESLFGSRFDGAVLLIDEADNAQRNLRLGSFLKLLAERLQRHGCERLMVGLAGMPTLREVLRESHPSSLRIFDELQLDTLTRDESRSVLDMALEDANSQNDQKTTINDEAALLLAQLSEGFPHFIQQFGYCAFAADTDGSIDRDDVMRGAFGTNGALGKIGDRYYRDDFYNKIQKESYRQVLRIMADSENRWIPKVDIRAKFHGKTTTLDNAIQALRERKIILAKEGERGVYRLQHRGFAYWIKLYAIDPATYATLLNVNPPAMAILHE